MYKNHRYTLLVGIVLSFSAGLGWSAANWDDRLLEEVRRDEGAKRSKQHPLPQALRRGYRQGADEQAAALMATTAVMMAQMQQIHLEEEKERGRRADQEKKDRQAQQAAKVQARLVLNARERAQSDARDQAIQNALLCRGNKPMDDLLQH